MAILSKQSATELRRIIKEATGRDLSSEDVQWIWRFIVKLLHVLRSREYRQSLAPRQSQPGLFDKPKKKGG